MFNTIFANEYLNSPFTSTKTFHSCIHTFKNYSYCETSVGEIRYSLAKIVLDNVHYALYNIADGVETIHEPDWGFTLQ